VAAALVAHGGAYRFGDRIEILEEIIDIGRRRERWLLGQRFVEFGDVGLVMLVVMKVIVSASI
jgi:hypothetical protein